MSSAQTKYDVFLSYTAEDRERVTELRGKLAELGIRVFDAADVSPVEHALKKLQDALETSRLIVLMVSPDSLKSTWVNFEVGAALSMGKRIIPILSKNVNQKDLPLPILSRVSFSPKNIDEMAQQIGAAVKSKV